MPPTCIEGCFSGGPRSGNCRLDRTDINFAVPIQTFHKNFRVCSEIKILLSGQLVSGFRTWEGGLNTYGSKNISTQDCNKRLRPTQNPSRQISFCNTFLLCAHFKQIVICELHKQKNSLKLKQPGREESHLILSNTIVKNVRILRVNCVRLKHRTDSHFFP